MVGAAAGAVIGAVAATALSNKKTREKVKEKLVGIKDQAMNMMQKMGEDVKEKGGKVKGRIEERTRKTSKK